MDQIAATRYFRHLMKVANRHAGQFSETELRGLRDLVEQMEEGSVEHASEFAGLLAIGSKVAIQSAEQDLPLRQDRQTEALERRSRQEELKDDPNC